MIRLLLAAAVTAALLATALPAVEDARTERVAASLDADAERVVRATESLAYGEDPTQSLSTAPRRTVRLSLPARSWTAADLSYVAVGGRPEETESRPVLTYAFSGGRETERRLSLPVPLRTPDGPVVLRDSGTHTLSISLLSESEAPVVVVRSV
ncbi:hypothetical protein SAMN04488063_0814 [Halopelagius inordinatus]|uniref:DUF7311 domain-containing protein n=1 Tax=Halopelagius inordinatus TaxID=553467 RepID=A0A1I2MLN7_9EURY|nr:hypothetical protein [Halopelagius inordinatus]SFF92424.1 hypothetical protein SAMN04488063_0814 [Halopelagius inordinatus]